MGHNLNLYARPDIIVKDDNNLSVYDIKTGDRYSSEHKFQISLYSYVYSHALDLKPDNIKGYIFFTKHTKIHQVLWNTYNSIKDVVFNSIDTLNRLYQKFKIDNTYDIKQFTENLVFLKKKELSHISDILFDTYNKESLCVFCNLKPICPIYNNKQNKYFTNMVDKNRGKDVILSENIPQKEII